MAKAVIKLISDNDLRIRLAKKGLETCQEFTWDKVTDKFENALNKIIEQTTIRFSKSSLRVET